MKLFVSIHQNVTVMPEGSYPDELLEEQISEGESKLKVELKEALHDLAELDFVFVDIWIIDQDLEPTDIRYLRKRKELSVCAGIDHRKLSRPPSEKDAQVLLALARVALNAALERVRTPAARGSGRGARKEALPRMLRVEIDARAMALEDALEVRHKIQDALSEFLVREGMGDVDGGSNGAEAIEMFCKINSNTHLRTAQSRIRAFLVQAGFSRPTLIESWTE